MALYILAGSVPAQQRLDGKAVAQVMQPRAWNTHGGMHLRLVEQLIEGPMDVSRVECRPPTRDEELRRRQPFGETIAVRAVSEEQFDAWAAAAVDDLDAANAALASLNQGDATVVAASAE